MRRVPRDKTAADGAIMFYRCIFYSDILLVLIRLAHSARHIPSSCATQSTRRLFPLALGTVCGPVLCLACRAAVIHFVAATTPPQLPGRPTCLARRFRGDNHKLQMFLAVARQRGRPSCHAGPTHKALASTADTKPSPHGPPEIEECGAGRQAPTALVPRHCVEPNLNHTCHLCVCHAP